ncbi:MAG: hypothetical protein N3E45_04025 [Oscillatoriaceae bacterium SKW80]|nr:hypothetical protein [Oscillatoriaceae bacterium SKYG93]MCX8119986.1 hypothetical protein [Oscillatoriaceae bacterium SKW80]MDW8454147.1 hypothetical protein [Oscillatoriaceae cyanobacterium SKYGB_i_bin93]
MSIRVHLSTDYMQTRVDSGEQAKKRSLLFIPIPLVANPFFRPQ